MSSSRGAAYITYGPSSSTYTCSSYRAPSRDSGYHSSASSSRSGSDGFYRSSTAYYQSSASSSHRQPEKYTSSRANYNPSSTSYHSSSGARTESYSTKSASRYPKEQRSSKRSGEVYVTYGR